MITDNQSRVRHIPSAAVGRFVSACDVAGSWSFEAAAEVDWAVTGGDLYLVASAIASRVDARVELEHGWGRPYPGLPVVDGHSLRMGWGRTCLVVQPDDGYWTVTVGHDGSLGHEEWLEHPRRLAFLRAVEQGLARAGRTD